MFKKDVKIALFFTWFILTIICAATLVIPFLFSKDKVLGNTPVCISKSKYNQECMLCGSTTAFIEISEGNFKNAYNLNRGSVVIFAVFFINLCIFIIVAVSYRSVFFNFYSTKSSNSCRLQV